jgi:gamma-tubulin complex component 3
MHAAGEVGWDVFSLSYNPAAGLPATMLGAGGGGGPQPTPAPTSGGPLSALFTAQAMLSYGRLAKLLWRMKRSEHALSATWGAAACGLQRTVDKMGRGEKGSSVCSASMGK